MIIVHKHPTNQADALEFAKTWAVKNSAGKIANLARCYLAVCRDVLSGVKVQVLRWHTDLSGESTVEACLYAVCGCGIIHTNVTGPFFACQHCKKRGVRAGAGLGEFHTFMMTRPRKAP